MTNNLSIIYASPSCQTPAAEAALAADMIRRARAEGNIARLPNHMGAHGGGNPIARERALARGEATGAVVLAALTRPMTVQQLVEATGRGYDAVASAVSRLTKTGSVSSVYRTVDGHRVRVVTAIARQAPPERDTGAIRSISATGAARNQDGHSAARYGAVGVGCLDTAKGDAA